MSKNEQMIWGLYDNEATTWVRTVGELKKILAAVDDTTPLWFSDEEGEYELANPQLGLSVSDGTAYLGFVLAKNEYVE